MGKRKEGLDDLPVIGADVAFAGGEPDDDLDGFNSSEMDRGDSVEPPTKAEEAEEEAPEVEEAEEAEEEAPEAEEKAEEAEEEAPEAEEEAPEAEEEPPEEPEKGKKEPEKGKKEGWIPKDRFDEVNERRKAAEKRLQELEAQEKAAEEGQTGEYDFDAAEKEYMELVLDGRTEEATAKRREIRQAEREMYQQEAQTVSSRTVTADKVREDIDKLANEAADKYPALDNQSDDFNEDAVYEIGDLFETFSKKLPPTAAFQKAVRLVVKDYDLKPAGAEEPESEPEKKPPVNKTKEKIGMSKQQPPVSGTEGQGGDAGGTAGKIDITKLSDADLDALPEKTLRRLRGDFL